MKQYAWQLYSCAGGYICLFCIQLVVIVLAFILGLALALKPQKAIDMQIRLYRLFNWEIKPISMEKEVRNMRIAGITTAVLSIAVLIFALTIQ